MQLNSIVVACCLFIFACLFVAEIWEISSLISNTFMSFQLFKSRCRKLKENNFTFHFLFVEFIEEICINSSQHDLCVSVERVNRRNELERCSRQCELWKLFDPEQSTVNGHSWSSRFVRVTLQVDCSFNWFELWEFFNLNSITRWLSSWILSLTSRSGNLKFLWHLWTLNCEVKWLIWEICRIRNFYGFAINPQDVT